MIFKFKIFSFVKGVLSLHTDGGSEYRPITFVAKTPKNANTLKHNQCAECANMITVDIVRIILEEVTIYDNF